MKFQNLVGQKFNKLLVIEYVGKSKFGQSRWLCQCDCGNKHDVLASHLKNNNVKSCGCIMSESHIKHGMSYTVEWNSYHAAKKRCKPEQSVNYPDHAGKGIEFKFNSFEEFYAEVGPRPEPKFDYSLDRWPNPYGHYEKGNIRWATKKQQALNRACECCVTRNNVLEQSKALGII